MDARELERVLSLQLGAVVRPVREGLGEHADLLYEVRTEGDTHLMALELKTAPAREATRLARWHAERRELAHEPIPVVAASRLTARDREVLRQRGVNHMDLRGNLWIRWPGFYAQMEGKLPGLDAMRRRTGRGSNPFSRKASLVARVLLEDPRRSWGVREISEEASLALGYTSEVLRSLMRRGYATKEGDGHTLTDAIALLRDWSAAYTWEDNEIRSFVASYEKEELIEALDRALRESRCEYAHTLLSGTDHVVPHVQHGQVQLYVLEYSRTIESVLRERLYAEPVNRGGNLHVLVPYYGRAAFYGCRVEAGVPVVSNVQLFLDLVHYPLRGVEVLDVLLRRALAPQLQLEPRDQTRLRAAIGF